MQQSEELFTQIVNEHKSSIYAVCYMFSSNEEEVNDLFQETLINLWKGMESFREDSKASTWIYRVAMNTCISQERKKKRRGTQIPLSMDLNLYDESESDNKQIRMLHERIGRLGLVDRAIVMMWLDGMSYDEIGAVVGITSQNVGTKLFRIKEQLKKG